MIGPSTKDLYEAFKESSEQQASLLLSLIEILTEKGILNEENVKQINKKRDAWISRFDQMNAEKIDKILHSNSKEGSKARMSKAFMSVVNGDLPGFRKWVDLEHKITTKE